MSCVRSAPMIRGGRMFPCRPWKCSRSPRRHPVRRRTIATTGMVSFWETSPRPTCGWMPRRRERPPDRNPSRTCLRPTSPPHSFHRRSSLHPRRHQLHPHCRHRQVAFQCLIHWRPKPAHRRLRYQHHKHSSAAGRQFSRVWSVDKPNRDTGRWDAGGDAANPAVEPDATRRRAAPTGCGGNPLPSGGTACRRTTADGTADHRDAGAAAQAPG